MRFFFFVGRPYNASYFLLIRSVDSHERDIKKINQRKRNNFHDAAKINRVRSYEEGQMADTTNDPRKSKNMTK